jgi:hypothetical protein
MLQKPVTLILLASLFASVARAFEAAFHAKIFTFGGTAALQIFDQQGFSPSGKLLEAGKLACFGVDCSAYTHSARRKYPISLIAMLTHHHHLTLTVLFS